MGTDEKFGLKNHNLYQSEKLWPITKILQGRCPGSCSTESKMFVRFSLSQKTIMEHVSVGLGNVRLKGEIEALTGRRVKAKKRGGVLGAKRKALILL